MTSLRVGLDIGGTKVLGVVVDDAARVRATLRLPTGYGPDDVVASAAAAVDGLADRLGLPRNAFQGIGVGVPGLVDAERGVLAHAVNLGVDSAGLALADRLGELTGLPVAVENDVNAAALGVYRALGLDGPDGRDVAYLSIGTGLAVGLVLDGHIRRGARGTAGEIGHVPLDPAGPPCPCGQRGCLEVLASGSAIARAGTTAAALFAADATNPGTDGADSGLRDRIAGYLAAAVRLLVLTVDVDVVVLGGGVAADVGEPLRAAVADALARDAAQSPFLAALDLPGRVALVPDDRPVAAIGAALAAAARAQEVSWRS